MSTDFPADMAAAWLHDRLANQLRHRRERFLVDYSAADKPAMVLQVMPTAATQVDVRSDALAKVLRREGAQPDVAWWRQFASSSRAVPVFDGVAMNVNGGSGGWATELHTDGHLIAGVWEFPGNEQRSMMGEFYEQVFVDFAGLAQSVYEVAAVTGRGAVTCSLLQANQLALAKRNGNAGAPAPKRETLEWPLAELSSPADLGAAMEQMRARFCRAYGYFSFE
jgi:hypothetical protein